MKWLGSCPNVLEQIPANLVPARLTNRADVLRVTVWAICGHFGLIQQFEMQTKSSGNPCCLLMVAGCLQASLFQEGGLCRLLGLCQLIIQDCEEASACPWERRTVVVLHCHHCTGTDAFCSCHKRK